MSVVCQTCGGELKSILSLGMMPPPNEMPKINEYQPTPQPWYPTDLMYCPKCELAQLGYVPDPTVSFPDDYPYTSGATPALKINFKILAHNASEMLNLRVTDLVIDIGSNDGTLLSCFDRQQNVLGIEPTSAADIAHKNHISTEKAFFTDFIAVRICNEVGQARLITCTNCFAHMPDIHTVIENIKYLLTEDGVFISESHYLIDLLDTLQYDTIYAEHLRYYTVHSLTKLLAVHGLRVFRVERTNIHGGSIRVYADKGYRTVDNVNFGEGDGTWLEAKLRDFAERVRFGKYKFLRQLSQDKLIGCKIVGIGAPSRASTVISYCGLNSDIISYVCEQPHSLKIDRYMPGTTIPVVPESLLYDDHPETAILFSWHLADELIPKLRAKGYEGDIILPCSGKVITAKEAVA